MAKESQERENHEPAQFTHAGRVRRSTDTSHLLPKLVRIQAALSDIAEDAENAHFHNRYASLPATLAHIKPALNAENIYVAQTSGVEDGWIVVATQFIDAPTGEFVEASFCCPAPPADPQKAAAVVTYGRRYTPAMLLAIASGENDDDAESVVASMREDAVFDNIVAQIPKALRGLIKEVGWNTPKLRTQAMQFYSDGVLDVDALEARVSAALDKKLADAEGGA